jgi:hypothetical protein
MKGATSSVIDNWDAGMGIKLPPIRREGADEQERLAIVLDWMWAVVLPYYQPVADEGRFGNAWRRMTTMRTDQAAWAAEWAAACALIRDKPGAYQGRIIAQNAAYAAMDAQWVGTSALYAGVVAAEVAVGSADADAAWKHFDPCGLLAKLIEVGK